VRAGLFAFKLQQRDRRGTALCLRAQEKCALFSVFLDGGDCEHASIAFVAWRRNSDSTDLWRDGNSVARRLRAYPSAPWAFADGTDEAQSGWRRGRPAQRQRSDDSYETRQSHQRHESIRDGPPRREMIGQDQGHTPIGRLRQYAAGAGFSGRSNTARIFVYSLTKYIGRSFRPIAGAALGSESPHERRQSVTRRPSAPNGPPFLLDDSRSLETLRSDLEKADRNARLVEDYLHDQAKWRRSINLLPHERPPTQAVCSRGQCNGAAHVLVRHCRGKAAALNSLTSCKSSQWREPGGTESLASNARKAWTHSRGFGCIRQKIGVRLHDHGCRSASNTRTTDSGHAKALNEA